MSGESLYLRLRGLRFHLRCWGAEEAPLLVYCHGWLDTTATFADVGERLGQRFRVVALDQRGYGYSEWPVDGYWFPDYVADLETLLDRLSPEQPVRLAGHSMGGQVASLYAGLRPARVSKLAVLDSLFLPDMPAGSAPRRFNRWLDQLKAPERGKTYASFEELAARVRKQHPQLSEERALFVARGWGAAGSDGRIRLLADPKHRLDMPSLYRNAESMEIWKGITAPTLFLDAGASAFVKVISPEEKAARRACFRDQREAVIADAGHMLHFDAPEATAQALLDFF
ncbi:MAG: alpha/beta hydrolase [Stagnimonas sp.]|nr:alpha/beta hydrolase [Stagnimonas sp.]